MKRRKERGQALAEFALTLPILMMFLLGIIDFGRVFFTYAQVSNNLRQSLRQAANVGYSGKTYLDCTKMKNIATNTSLATSSVSSTVIYYIDNAGTQKTCTNTGDVLDTDVKNGDFIQINVQATINVFVLPSNITLNFTGRRTIVKSLEIGAIANDSDFDGLNDVWEFNNFGNYAQNGLGDFDNDGYLNGAEEACASNPILNTSTCLTP